MRIKRIKIRKRGPRIALEKIRRKELYYLPLINIVFCFYFEFYFLS